MSSVVQDEIAFAYRVLDSASGLDAEDLARLGRILAGSPSRARAARLVRRDDAIRHVASFYPVAAVRFMAGAIAADMLRLPSRALGLPPQSLNSKFGALIRADDLDALARVNRVGTLGEEQIRRILKGERTPGS